jgi:Ras-related protein Rab-2A
MSSHFYTIKKNVMYKYLFKCIAVGESGVGKSCIVLQFTNRRFQQFYDLTIGVEFGCATRDIGETKVKFQIWDTAGQEVFRSITRSYYRGSAIALLVYDITARETFCRLDDWVQEIHQNAKSDIMVILVGNKNDLGHIRQVSKEEGQRFATEHNFIFTETSAKTGYSIDHIFEEAGRAVINQIDNGKLDICNPSSGVKAGMPDHAEDKSCCIVQ